MHVNDHRLTATLQITSVDSRKMSAFDIIIQQQQKTLITLLCVLTPGSSPPFNGRGSLFPLLLFPLLPVSAARISSSERPFHPKWDYTKLPLPILPPSLPHRGKTFFNLVTGGGG